MSYIEYNTKWVSEPPPIGVECPVCKKGIVEGNDFTDKKGNPWHSSKCKECFTKWMKSKGKPGGGTKRILDEDDEGKKIIANQEVIKRGIGLVRGDVKRVEDLMKSIEAQIIGEKVDDR